MSNDILSIADGTLEVIDTKINFEDPTTDYEQSKEYKKAVLKFSQKIYYAHIVEEFYRTGKLPFKTNNEKILTIMNSTYQRLATKPPYWFITINPRPNVSLEEFKKRIEKIVRKVSVKEYFYVYEVRKQDFSGLHCHMIVRTTARPYDFKRGIKNTVKSICDCENSSILNFKNITEDVIRDKIDYMLGQKKDSKMAGVLATEEYRKENVLDKFYESSTPFTCRGAQKAIS